jgi:hypothetical protein
MVNVAAGSWLATRDELTVTSGNSTGGVCPAKAVTHALENKTTDVNFMPAERTTNRPAKQGFVKYFRFYINQCQGSFL